MKSTQEIAIEYKNRCKVEYTHRRANITIDSFNGRTMVFGIPVF